MILQSKYDVNADMNYAAIKSISKSANIDYRVVKLLFFRGIDSREKIDRFLNPKEEYLNDPFAFNDMEKVINILKTAKNKSKRILIYGDYDVDGMSATAILFLYLKSQGYKIDYFLPNRYVDGYGLTIEAIDKIIAEKNPDLFITVDCGITSKDEVEYIKKLGKEIIVTDHHEPIDGKVPSCPIINPKNYGEKYPFKELCGAGVALKLVHALGGIDHVRKYLDIAALATIADIVELVDENRVIAQLGIRNFVNNPNYGLKTLAKKLNINLKHDLVLSTDIAFKIAPKINSAGRLGQPVKGLQLLIEEDKRQLPKIAEDLIELNKVRQEACKEIYKQAVDMLQDENINDINIIVLSSPKWDAGLIGITAAQLAAEYNRPVMLFSEVNGKFKGSARSINNINIHKALSCLKTPIDAFGGHKMAAGLTVDKKQFIEFKKQISECVYKEFGYDDFIPRRYYDIEMGLKDVNPRFIDQINYLKPFGHKNEMPVFKIKFTNKFPKRMKRFPEHIMFNLESGMDLISFNDKYGDDYYNYYKYKNTLLELQLNLFRGKKSPKGIIKSVKFEKLDKGGTKDIINAYYLNQITHPSGANKENQQNIEYVDQSAISNTIQTLLNKTNFGTLVVFNSYNKWSDLKSIVLANDVQEYFLKINDKFGLNSYVFGLNSFKNLNNYNQIVFTDPVLTKEYLLDLKKHTNAKIIVPNNSFDNSLMKRFNIDYSREGLAQVYSLLKNASKQKIKTNNIISYFTLLKRKFNLSDKLNFTNFLISIEIFSELDVIDIVSDKYSFNIKIKKTGKNNLTNSSIYKKIKGVS